MLRMISFGVLLVAASSLAMEESTLQSNYRTEVLPYFENSFEGSFFGKDGVGILYRLFEVDNEKGALVILPGRGEPIHKYAELVYDLRDLGYSVYLMSHRGQGESGHVDRCSIQYVESYDDYVADLEEFLTLVNRKSHSNLFLLGHSMGAAIGTLYSLKHPGAFKGLMLSAPMFDMNTSPYPKGVAKALAKTMVFTGFGKSKGASDDKQVTSSNDRQAITNEVLGKYSSIESQKISFGWAKASFDAIKTLKHADMSSLPQVLMLQAGKDLHVPSEGQNKICKGMPSCYTVRFPESYHEILMETDSIRDSALISIKKFLTRNTK
jgi:lysophospholipase